MSAQKIDDPFRVVVFNDDLIRWRRPGMPGLATGYYRAGLQPATSGIFTGPEKVSG